MNHCQECLMSMKNDENCECNPTLCYHCCKCKPDCECNCNKKEASKKNPSKCKSCGRK